MLKSLTPAEPGQMTDFEKKNFFDIFPDILNF